MLYKLILVLVPLQIAAATRADRQAAALALMSLPGYEEHLARLTKKSHKATNAAKPPLPKTNSKKELKNEHKKDENGVEPKHSRIASFVRSSKEFIVDVLNKPHTTGANRVRLSLKEKKKEDVVKCRNTHCCLSCNGSYKTHTGPWYKCYSECDKEYRKNHVAPAA